ncbi:hypothetical protein P170DRAFT_514096 [Aspergillus steynii IBT 23096]|uniref:F-box domain-containing protein n=1 Tax=Aspergillus steynii IBT 23096 TaxID=1392250 RepID=A0A2I2FT36_9EURO|nr:uncharacterized protein P170DRAFT_514096 [Aspergillus steynii IBT 23096]PLB43771.1 hypothetical protein P170DRAFT_514096 [Aspergillus steynii IBT 23096]
MATTLPTELIQSILLQTDPETYLSAHQTCRSWHHASSTPYMIQRILAQIPGSLVPPTDHLTPEQWSAYFAQTARLNLLRRRHHVVKSVAPRLLPPNCTGTTVRGASGDGQTVVVLRGAQVLVYRAADTSASVSVSAPASAPEADAEPQLEGEVELGPEPAETFSLASSLYPHWTSVCRALMDRSNAGCAVNQRTSKHRVAVSSGGEFVAVALGRVIQVYELHSSRSPRTRAYQADSAAASSADRAPPAEHVLGQRTSHGAFARAPTDADGYEDTDGVVEGLEFVENDTLLRVAIGKESTVHRPTRVRYLGCPDIVLGGRGLDLSYWRRALNTVYLDSAALGVSLARDGDARCQFRGLRLLDEKMGLQSEPTHAKPGADAEPSPGTESEREIQSRYFLASLQTNDIDTYCLGLATSSSSPSTSSSSISVTITRLLPSIYSRPANLIPTTPQTKDYPCLYPYPHESDPSLTDSLSHPQSLPQTQNGTNPNPNHKPTTSYTYNLQTTLPRFTSTNLPSGTFSSPLLAVSPDGQILAIYEPDHACCVVEGGALYICSIGECESVYRPGLGPRSQSQSKSESGSGSGFELERGELGQGQGQGQAERRNTAIDDSDVNALANGEKGKYPPREIIPSWPFLLDRVSVDVESIAVTRERGGQRYVVTAVAGDEVMEWVF